MSHDKAKDLADGIVERLEDGKDSAAKKYFTENWRGVVPELPYRIPVTLVSINRKSVSHLMAKAVDGKMPELKVDLDGDRFIIRFARGEKSTLGSISWKDQAIIEEIGPRMLKKYKPRLVGLKTREENAPTINIELVRPEISLCSSCGKGYYGDHANCRECRKKRRRKGDESFEHSPVAFHEAVDELVKNE